MIKPSFPRALLAAAATLTLVGGVFLPAALGCNNCPKWLSLPAPKELDLSDGHTPTILECEADAGCPAALGTRHLVACGVYSYTKDDDSVVKQLQCAYDLDPELIDPQDDPSQLVDSHDCGYPCTFDPADPNTRCVSATNGFLTCRQLDCRPGS